MRAYAIIFVSAFAASFMWGTVAIKAARDIANPPGPCSVLDYRRCNIR